MREEKKKILHVLGGATLHGGCGKTVAAIASFTWPGYEHGILVHQSFDESISDGIELIRTGAAVHKQGSILYDMLYFPSEVRALMKAVKSYNPSLLHAHTRTGMFASALVGGVAGLPVLAHMHVLGARKWLYRMLFRVSRVTAVLNSKKTMDYYGLQCPTHIVYPFIEWPEEPVRDDESAKSVSRYITASDIVPVKKIDLMIRAWECLNAGEDARPLVIYGAMTGSKEGPYQQSVLQAAERADRVSIEKWSDRWLAESGDGDIYVHLSTMDSFGLSLLEAFAQGLRLVVSRDTFLRELPEPLSSDGVFVAASSSGAGVAKAMRDAASCGVSRRELWARRRKVAEMFSANRNCAALCVIYDALCHELPATEETS